jgi:hypothetical protein
MSGIISGKEIKVPEEIKCVLDANENVLLAVQQAGLGGKTMGLESIFVTDKRVIKMTPKTLGLRSDVTDFNYKDMANVKLDKGILRSSIGITMRFLSEPVYIKNISKEGANRIIKMIQDGIAGRLGNEITDSSDATVSSSQMDITEQIRKLGELKDIGILTDEEFQTKKTELLSKL